MGVSCTDYILGVSCTEKVTCKSFPKRKTHVVNCNNYATNTLTVSGVEPGNMTMKVRLKKGDRDTYEYKNIEIVPMERLMDQFIGSRLIHFCTMDMEGM